MADRTLFCDHCGRILSDDSFGKGEAYLVQGRPFCAPCRPPERLTDRRPYAAPPEEAPGTRIIPAMKALGSPTSLLILGGIAAAVAVVAVVVTAVGTARQVGKPDSLKTSDSPPSPQPVLNLEEAERRIRDLEGRAAASTDPDEVLRWCEECRLALQDTPFEARRRGVEVSAREEKARRATDLDTLLAELRKGLEGRPVEERRPDLEALIAAALQVAGPRRGEVAPLKAEYDRKVEQAARRAGLVGRWCFDETSGAEIRDVSGKGHHARLTGGALRVLGRFGGALRFAGPADPVELPAAKDLDLAEDASFTLAAWYRPEPAASGSEHAIFVRGERGLGLRFGRGNRGVMAHLLEGDLEAGAVAPEPIGPGDWHHLAGTVDIQAGATRLYVNGRLVRTASWAPGTCGRDAGGAPWRIGAGAIGTIDDVRLYRRVLTTDDVRDLYNERAKP